MLETPSIVMLFEFGRWPLTVKPLTEPISEPPVFWESTPGASVARPKSMRPLFPMFLSASLSRVNARSPLADCTSVTRLDTLTSSVKLPTCSVSIPALSLSFAFTTTVVRSSVLKPWSVTFME